MSPSPPKGGRTLQSAPQTKKDLQIRNCFETNAKTMISNYSKRGYPNQILIEALDKVRAVSRADLLTPPEPIPLQTSDDLFCIIPYNPNNPPIKDILERHWPILEADPKLTDLTNRRVIIGHRRPKNLRDLLVKSRLQYSPKPKTTNDQMNPNKICNTKDCRYCPKLDLSGKITSTTTGRQYMV